MVIFSPRHVAAVGDEAQPVLELPVLLFHPVHLLRQVLQVPLLSPAGPPGRFPVRHHATPLPLVNRVDCPARPLRTGVPAWLEQGQELLHRQIGF
ncbi:hypothetical protein TIFTF001_005607 [Ficus carica]|uniref:Uncharacterized protein n=1 Tax=Ficus carica TaxID=3494 RepID=A0AA87ZFC6_FICCA|nr:hypothetical protein TIFTF001_005607 [Ficus carica]